MVTRTDRDLAHRRPAREPTGSLPHLFYSRFTAEHILLRALACQSGLKPAES
jgi:hypothetical protein